MVKPYNAIRRLDQILSVLIDQSLNLLIPLSFICWERFLWL